MVLYASGPEDSKTAAVRPVKAEIQEAGPACLIRDKKSVCVCLYKEPVQSNGISDKHAGRTEKNRVIKCDIFVYERKNFM